MILLFAGILAILFLAARLFTGDQYMVPTLLERIPGIKTIYEIARCVPGYLIDVNRMLFGKKDSVSFIGQVKGIREKDEAIKASLQKYFTDESLPLRPFWIFIPFFNIAFLPKLLISRTTKYVLAIGQGLVITLFAILV